MHTSLQEKYNINININIKYNIFNVLYSRVCMRVTILNFKCTVNKIFIKRKKKKKGKKLFKTEFIHIM